MHDQLQFFRKFAIELELFDKDIVKAAGVFRKVKNWFRAFQSPEYRKQIQNLNEQSGRVNYLLSNLGKEINKLQSAISDADVYQYEESLRLVKEYTSELNSELGTFDQATEFAYENVPTEMKEVDDFEERKKHWNLPVDYRKNPDIVNKLKQYLDERGVDVPLGKVYQPLSNFKWFKQFTSNDVFFNNPTVRTEWLRKIIEIIDRSHLGGGGTDLINNVANQLMENIKQAIINGFLLRYAWSPVSDRGLRTGNEMFMVMQAGPINIPTTDIFFNVAFYATDMMASLKPEKKISIGKIVSIRAINPPETAPVEDAAEQRDDAGTEKTSNRKEQLKKLAKDFTGSMQIVPRIKTQASREDVRAELARAVPEASTTGIELLLRQTSAETANFNSMYNWNVGNITASTRYSGPAYRPFWFTADENSKSRMKNLYRLMYEHKAPYAFRAYNNLREGVQDYVRQLRHTFPSILEAAIKEDPNAMGHAIYNSGYTTDVKPEDAAKMLGKGLPGVPQMQPQQEQQQIAGPLLEEYNDLMQSLFASGTVEAFVKKAITKVKLPNSKFLIVIEADSMPTKVRFARILTTALREELDADASVHNYKNKIELECDIVGSQESAFKAVTAVTSIVSDMFKIAWNKKVSSEIYKEINSSYDIIDSQFSEKCFRKFAFEVLNHVK